MEQTKEAAEGLAAGTEEIAVLPAEGGLEIYKKSQCEAVRLEDEFCYWLCVINRSSMTAEQITITDTLCEGLKPVECSLWLDGRQINGDLSEGIVIPQLASGDFVILSYAVRVCEQPETGSFANTAWVDYRLAGSYGRAVSNTVQVMLESCAVQMGYFVQQTAADCQERINCTGYITNSGNCLLEEVFLSLRIPSGACLLPETLSFDQPVEPGSDLQRLCLGQLEAGQTIRFSFQLLVEAPGPGRARGQAFAYGYCAGGQSTCSQVFVQDFYWNQSC